MEAGSTPPSSHDDKTSDGEKSRKELETPPIDDKAVEMMKMRLDEAVSHNNVLKKENGDLKTKLSACLTPEQTARLKNDNKRLLSLTERINKQRTNLEEKLNNKKTECGNLEKDLSANKEQLETVIADRNKLKEMVENLLAEIEKQREEIRVLKDGKSFADFVELKRQIKELKTENGVLSNGLKCDNKGSLKFNLNDLATMLRLKQGDTLDALSKHNQTQRVVVLDERELEESIRRGDHASTLCESAGGPSPPHTPNHQTSRSAGMTRQSSRINFISPPRSLNTSPRTFSRQSSCRDRWLNRPTPPGWDGNLPGVNQTHFIVRRRSSPRWPSLGELKERYRLGLQGAWTAKPSIDEVSEYISKQQGRGGT